MNTTENSTSNTSAPELELYEYPGIWAFLTLIIFSIVGDILTLFVIKRTRTLKSYTGDLLISQVSSCIPRQLLVVLLIFTSSNVQDKDTIHTVRCTLILLLTGFQGITSHTLAAICLNLYFAVCHSTLYRTRMSRDHVLVFIPVCWIVNIFVGMCPLASKDPLIVSIGIIQVPSYGGSALWAWLFIVNFVYVIPAIVTAFAFIKIWFHSRKVGPELSVSMQFRDKYRLSKVVSGLATCYLTLWSLVHIFYTIQSKYDNEGTIFGTLATISYVLNLIYDALKLGVYMVVYKPIRLTVLELYRKMRRKISPLTTVEVLSNENRSTSHA